MSECPECEAEVGMEANFCRECGTSFQRVGGTNVRTGQTSRGEEQHGRKAPADNRGRDQTTVPRHRSTWWRLRGVLILSALALAASATMDAYMVEIFGELVPVLEMSETTAADAALVGAAIVIVTALLSWRLGAFAGMLVGGILGTLGGMEIDEPGAGRLWIEVANDGTIVGLAQRLLADQLYPGVGLFVFTGAAIVMCVAGIVGLLEPFTTSRSSPASPSARARTDGAAQNHDAESASRHHEQQQAARTPAVSGTQVLAVVGGAGLVASAILDAHAVDGSPVTSVPMLEMPAGRLAIGAGLFAILAAVAGWRWWGLIPVIFIGSGFALMGGLEIAQPGAGGLWVTTDIHRIVELNGQSVPASALEPTDGLYLFVVSAVVLTITGLVSFYNRVFGHETDDTDE